MAYTRTRVHCINAGSRSACVTSKTDCVCVHDEKNTTTEDLNSKSSEPAFYIVVSEPASDAYYVCTYYVATRTLRFALHVVDR